MENHLEDFYTTMSKLIVSSTDEKTELKAEFIQLQKKYKKLETEFARYKSVSMVKTLDRELFEKTNEIVFLKKKIKHMELKQSKVVEELEEDEDIEVELITIDKTDYYITQDIHKDIYEKLEDDSVGKVLGKFIRNKIVYNN
tara:strand:- start:200 stop:625 length:426 start_codon:yes stop_codon:yes gene_type:complete